MLRRIVMKIRCLRLISRRHRFWFINWTSHKKDDTAKMKKDASFFWSF